MIEEVIARQLQLPLRHVQGAVRLLREGATVPFISRYRKEATGSMDEVQVGAVKEALERLTALEARRATVLETIGGQGRLTDELRRTLRPERYVGGGVGLPTVTDILEALDKRGLDPREQLHVFSFAPDIHTIDDLREGMRLPGIVTNVTAFGAFVDIGIKQDGLVHVSQLADRYVASPAEVVRLDRLARALPHRARAAGYLAPAGLVDGLPHNPHARVPRLGLDALHRDRDRRGCRAA